jgi:hypothetical protein
MKPPLGSAARRWLAVLALAGVALVGALVCSLGARKSAREASGAAEGGEPESIPTSPMSPTSTFRAPVAPPTAAGPRVRPALPPPPSQVPAGSPAPPPPSDEDTMARLRRAKMVHRAVWGAGAGTTP